MVTIEDEGTMSEIVAHGKLEGGFVTNPEIEDETIFEGVIVWIGDEHILQYVRTRGLVLHARGLFDIRIYIGMRILVHYICGPKNGMVSRPVDPHDENTLLSFKLNLMHKIGAKDLACFKFRGGACSLKFSLGGPKGFKGAIYLEEIRSYNPGRGHGGELMSAITRAADEVGARIALRIVPIYDETMNYEQLAFWYRRAGFIENANGVFIRKPEKIHG